MMKTQERSRNAVVTTIASSELNEMARMYRDGVSPAQLATIFSMSESTVRMYLRRAARKGMITQAG